MFLYSFDISSNCFIISSRFSDFIKTVALRADNTTKSSPGLRSNFFLKFFGITICHFVQIEAVPSILGEGH
jgi:hypothetical protein